MKQEPKFKIGDKVNLLPENVIGTIDYIEFFDGYKAKTYAYYFEEYNGLKFENKIELLQIN
jgi:hypothetical protein